MKTDVRTLYRRSSDPDLAESFREVELSGWVRTNRAFFRSVQIVYEETFLENFAEVSKLTLSSAITVKGELELTPEGKQPFEIKARKIILEAASDPD